MLCLKISLRGNTMSQLQILEYPDERLRRICEPITNITPEIKKLLDDMAETMYLAPGIGLAAAQVGIPYRAIVIDIGEEDQDNIEPSKLYKLINPEIISTSGSVVTEEGCLSVPGIRECVKRASTVHVRALNENGDTVDIQTSGLLAVCLQHEIDHLNGILFTDNLSKLRRELIKGKLNKLKKAATHE